MKRIMALMIVASLVLAGGFSSICAGSIEEVVWNAYGAQGIQLPDGDQVPLGDNVYVVALKPGRTTANVQSDFAAGNTTAIFSTDLTIFGQGVIGDGTSTAGGYGETTDWTVDNSFNGLTEYVVAIDSTAPGTATAFGMWTATNVQSPDVPWLFPNGNAVPPGNSMGINLDDANVAVVGGVQQAWGAGANDWGYTEAATLASIPLPIPEPSTMVLVAVGLLGAIGMRRRNHRS